MSDVSQRLQALLTKLESDRSPLGRLMHDKEMSDRLSSSVKGMEAVGHAPRFRRGGLRHALRATPAGQELKELRRACARSPAAWEKGQGTMGKLFTDDAALHELDKLTGRVDSLLTQIDSARGARGRWSATSELYAT